MRHITFWGLLALGGFAVGWSQSSVAINISLTNPVTNTYTMQVTNNNSGSWAIDQLHVLFTTPGVLTSVSAPANWLVHFDVPWDAIPHALRYDTTVASARIQPGQTKTFQFKMNVPTPVEDFYIQFRSVDGTTTKEYAERIKILQPLDVPSDAPLSKQVSVPTPGPGLQGALFLNWAFDFTVPTLKYRQILSAPGDELVLDEVFYPEIPEPPHLEHYFVGSVERSVEAPIDQSGQFYTICTRGSLWNGNGAGISGLYWTRESARFDRPGVRWQIMPSLPQRDGTRVVKIHLTNRSRSPIVGNAHFYFFGSQMLDCGAALRGWMDVVRPSLTFAVDLAPNASVVQSYVIPANTPLRRFFYGAIKVSERAMPTPTEYYFSVAEVNAPLLVGYFNPPSARPADVQLLNTLTGETYNFTVSSNADGVWKLPLQAGMEALFSSNEVYQPIWRVKVKPRGALSQTFTNVLVPGGDTIDPYLRANLILGDVNGDDCIDDADLLEVLFQFGQSGTSLSGDLNRDGLVDDADLLIVLFNFGAGC
ncbi:MAG: hypothetical protein SNJ72_04620 [Fimbriimonadales bacterium]